MVFEMTVVSLNCSVWIQKTIKGSVWLKTSMADSKDRSDEE